MNGRTGYIKKLSVKIGLDPHIGVIRKYVLELGGLLAIHDNPVQIQNLPA
jgi:hypothetical protein